ncbi:MAG: fluoride efflux transporter CrcB [Bacteroidetes bacterium]|nr:fluoride efflux transporter CrcB [Bacteroidota bacterium]MCK5765562.1 fluoride efflux transporter CrcB [Bacteroidales bacterium]RLD36764.1 MAG: fluoride efflux transporter CrcB [Bacteroidota bacterium]RLD79601.1 MAG: fluoride efflux transporter CrcB [Bacteroidota bacterium]
MYKIILLLAGGGIGTVARYVVSDYTHKYYLGSFPLGTLAVNIIGSFIIGILWGMFDMQNLSHGLRAFLFIGILGGFTTFSSYAIESYNMFRDGDAKLAMLNIMANNVLSIGMVIIGLMVSSALMKL